MIVDTLVEDSHDLLDQEAGFTMGSAFNLGCFYSGSSPSSSSASCSPAHSSPSSSPYYDSEASGGYSVVSRGKGDYMGEKRHQRGVFQGVRVRHPVKELLMQLRNAKPLPVSCGNKEWKTQEVVGTFDKYSELRDMLGGSKRAHEYSSDGPASKRPAVFQTLPLLTPPSTPASMEEAQKNEPRADLNSDDDMLQNIINIKNESSPVSLNTVQVSWMNTVIPNQNSSKEPFQDIQLGHSYTHALMCQPFPASSPPQMMEQPQMYQFTSVPTHELQSRVPQSSGLEYNQFCGNGSSSGFQPSFPCQEQQHCSGRSFLPLLSESPGSSDAILSVQALTSARQQPETRAISQSFSPLSGTVCDSVQKHQAMLNSMSLTPEHQSMEGNKVTAKQLGKSFFQWQIEQEENKLVNLTQDQLLYKDSDGDTFLHIAVAQGRRALSYVLGRKIAALHMLDVKEHNSQSALQVAVAANQHLIVQDLVNLGAQVNTTDRWGRTPLHVCAEKGYAQALQAIQKGATVSNQYVDLEATNYEGLTALHCAVMTHNAVVHELQQVQQRHSPEVQELLMKNKSLVDTIKALIQMGASVEARDRKSGRSALHLAAEEANLELLRLFLELPNCLSFINAKAYNGNSALHVAASLQYRVSQVDAVRLLMRKGADPSVRNLENEQPVHLVPDGPDGEQIKRILKGKAVQQRASTY
ncbi:NF-kappa-B inhibitor zeta isoform X2 [Microcaecilia unicolor]|uniref:NF-kappa-B inhibitor zeta isoform X2 n=1 Tax=Microcaecilia unicolor TaxID=1415580 RepID=A0A6P7Y525_9AMPH|nr:NF-kappa-B inhibitor zeta isoform X2 [Microcaecilia unicolor]